MMPGPTNPLVTARPYDFDLPAGYDPSKAYPLIVLVHGYGANGFVQDALFGFGAARRRPRRVRRAPRRHHRRRRRRTSGTPTDACCDNGHTGVDDVAYLNAVVDDMEANFNIDKKRVFFVGHSNGGFMSHRMACDAAGRVAGIVALAGDNWQDADASATRRSRWRCCRSTATPTRSCPTTARGLMPSAKESVAPGRPRTAAPAISPTPARRSTSTPTLAGAETSVARYTLHQGRGRAVDHPRRPARAVADRLPDWGNDVFDWLMQHPKT